MKGPPTAMFPQRFCWDQKPSAQHCNWIAAPWMTLTLNPAPPSRHPDLDSRLSLEILLLPPLTGGSSFQFLIVASGVRGI